MKEKSVFLFDGRLIFSYVSSSFVHIIILRSVATSSPYSTAQWFNIHYGVALLFIFNQKHFHRIQIANFNSRQLLWTLEVRIEWWEPIDSFAIRACYLSISSEDIFNWQALEHWNFSYIKCLKMSHFTSSVQEWKSTFLPILL